MYLFAALGAIFVAVSIVLMGVTAAGFDFLVRLKDGDFLVFAFILASVVIAMAIVLFRANRLDDLYWGHLQKFSDIQGKMCGVQQRLIDCSSALLGVDDTLCDSSLLNALTAIWKMGLSDGIDDVNRLSLSQVARVVEIGKIGRDNYRSSPWATRLYQRYGEYEAYAREFKAPKIPYSLPPAG